MSSPDPKPTTDHDELPEEVDFSNAVRGKHFAGYWRDRAPIALAPDLADEFPDSDAVNQALREYRRLRDSRHAG